MNKKITKDEFPERTVYDFWKAVRISLIVLFSSSTFLFLIIPSLILSIFSNQNIDIKNYLDNEIIKILLMIVFFSTPIVLSIISYITYIQGVKLKNGYFSWPASDVENSFIDLITLKRLRGIFYRERIPVHEIEYVTNDFGWSGVNENRKRIYNLNIAGAFGSRNIRFNSKQKRDEARNILRSFSKTVIAADIAFN